jgi:hypothetical protein
MEVLGDAFAVLEDGQALQLALEPGVLDGDRGLFGEGLDQHHIGLAQRRAALGVGHGQRAQGAAAHGQGDEQRRPDSGAEDRLGGPVVGPGVGEGHRLAGADHLTRHRPRHRERRSAQLLGEQPVSGLDPQPPGLGREGQGGQVRSHQRPGVADHQPQQLGGVDPGQDRGGDGPDRLQPLGAVPGLLVQLGVLDRHPGLGGQHDQGPLVVGVEVLAAVLVGQIQVAVDPATGGDRDAQKRPHRRVAGREPDRAGVIGRVVQAQRPGVVDQHPKDPPADRDGTDRRPLLGGHPGGDELADPAVAAQHPQRPVAGPGQLRG